MDENNEQKSRYNVVALRTSVLFPEHTLTVDVGRDKSVEAINKADGSPILVVTQKDKDETNPTESGLYNVGTLALVQQTVNLPTGGKKVVLRGIKRMKITAFTAFSPFIECEAEDYGATDFNVDERALVKLITEETEKIIKLETKPRDIKLDDSNPLKLVATMAYAVYNNDVERERLLELFSLGDQLTDIYNKTLVATDLLAAEKSIAKRVRESIEKSQKEYYLREQIKAIHDELGDDEDEKEGYMKTAKEKKLPQYAVDKLDKEIKRMSKMASNSPEAGVIRTYIEWLLDMPWGTVGNDEVDIKRARQILDEDHYGLEKIKERIVEYLGVHLLTKNLSGAILCFVGPPGVGKTSIVSSIARAANRTFVQMSLGGVRDEAEIRGHRRTYVGAMPGRILSGMKNAGVNNPVFLLDEIDKMSSDFRGDPASAMLEVLDPAQNCKFTDHYLEIPYDLSQTMFVATANSIDTIPSPLLDRMEVIYLTGYTYKEKLEIAKRYLLPKQTEKNGLKEGQIVIPDDVMMKIITDYTRESGVRNLERSIATVARKIAVKAVEDNETDVMFTVEESDLPDLLGVAKFKDSEYAHEPQVGVVTGLAWTSVGGVTLDVETALLEGGKGELTLTGSMGDVMKESAKIALSIVRANAGNLGIDPKKFSEYDIHIHIPEGATPKDGPSAGVTLTTSIASAFSGKKVRKDVAMTGEVTLTGRVLAIGGLKEKSLAAYMRNIKTLVIPKENEKDLVDVPQEVKDSLEIITVSKVEEVLDIALIK